jgi:hypothetical protein
MSRRQVLNFAAKFAISEWLRNNQERLRSERPLFTSLAREVKEKIGQVVSPQVIAEICRTVGVSWEPPEQKGIKSRSLLWSKIHELETNQKTMDQVLVSLCEKLGEPYPVVVK